MEDDKYSTYRKYMEMPANPRPSDTEEDPASLIDTLSLNDSTPEQRYHLNNVAVAPRGIASPVQKVLLTRIIPYDDFMFDYPNEDTYNQIANNRLKELLDSDDDDSSSEESNSILDNLPRFTLPPEIIPIKPYELSLPITPVGEKQKQKKEIIVDLIREPSDVMDYLEDIYKSYEIKKERRLVRDYEDIYDFGKHFFQHSLKFGELKEELKELRGPGAVNHCVRFENLRERIEKESLKLEIGNIKQLIRENSSLMTSIIPLLYDINETMKYCLILQNSKSKSQKLFRMLVYSFFYYNYVKFQQMQRYHAETELETEPSHESN